MRKLGTKRNAVDSLNALDAELVREFGGASSLVQPPDWFIKLHLRSGGHLIQAGITREPGMSNEPRWACRATDYSCLFA